MFTPIPILEMIRIVNTMSYQHVYRYCIFSCDEINVFIRKYCTFGFSYVLLRACVCEDALFS